MSIASEITRLQGAKADLATAIEGKGVTVPSATKLDGYADLVDAISQGGGGGTMQSKSVSYTPSTSAQSQTVTADAGYDGLSSVAVSVAAMPSGTEGTPTATKGTVSNHSIAVTPSVTNSAGYIEGGTKTGEAVTVSASDVTSGYQIKTANGTYDVTNLASLIVTVPNTYAASDEGKVVDNGALVAQTAHADVTPTTSDQTIDTTTNNSLKVKGDADLVAGNIKKDVEIFGVTGTYEGSGGGYTLDQVCLHQITGDVVFEENITTLDRLLYNCTGITSIRFKKGGATVYDACRNLTNCVKVSADDGYTFAGGQTSFYNDVKLKYIINARSAAQQTFAGCTDLEAVEFAGDTGNLTSTQGFQGDSKLKTIVIRKNYVMSMANVNILNAGTPFKSGGSGGDIYIPKTLYDALGTGTDDYKAASNWSTIDGYGTITWHAIEGSIYETQHVDGTPISA